MNFSMNSEWEEGFTLVESLTAVLVLILILSGSAFGIRSLFKTFESIREEKRYNQELLLFHTVLGDQTNRILVPWFSRFDLSLTGSELRVPYVDGNKEGELFISLTEEGVLLRYPGENDSKRTFIFRELSEAEPELLTISGHPAGLRFSFSHCGGKDTITGLFGSIPLSQEGVNE